MKYILFIFSLLLVLRSYSQEPLMPLMPEKDSVALAAERQLIYYQMLSGTLDLGEWAEPVKLPDFGTFFKASQSSYFYMPEGTLFHIADGFSPYHFRFGFSPFLRDETVFSGSVLKLNEKFTLGGYSFGANSVFSAPFPSRGLNNYDLRGSTLFLKYNVSKNFKIETRVNVTHGPGF